MRRDRESLEAELLALFSRGVEAPLGEAEFDRLAREVFAYQFARNAPYGAYCRARDRTPETVRRWEEIPALPTAAFKQALLTTEPECEAPVVYETSGTSRGPERRGRHVLPHTRLYDASLLPNFQAHLLPDVTQMRCLVFGPSAGEFPSSSLGHMHSRVLEEFGSPGSGVFWRAEGPDASGLAAAFAEAEATGTPVCLLGTVFGFVYLFDWLEEQRRSFHLPPGSRVMDTGGYKGRGREVPREEMYRLYSERLGVPRTHVVNEYGMTELSSQYYDRTLRETVRSGAPERAWGKAAPPWARVAVVDPDTLAPLPEGEVGLLRHFDLANLYSVSAIQTDDLGVRRGDGFEIVGRAVGAEPRGCSLAVEDFLRTRKGR